jgi:hypothetical protein
MTNQINENVQVEESQLDPTLIREKSLPPVYIIL